MNFLNFNSKKEAEEYFKFILSKYEMGEEFKSKEFIQLIKEKHYFVSKNKEYLPVKFRKMPNTYRGFVSHHAYQFEGFFTKDNIGWRPISWRKCIYPKSSIQEVKSALRRALDQIIFAFRKTNESKCNICGCKQDVANILDIHHTIPFEELFKELQEKVSKEEIKRVADLHKEQWSSPLPFKLPKDDIVVKTFFQLHKKSKLIYLCKNCHYKTHRHYKGKV